MTNILIIEDDPTVTVMLETAISNNGYRVRSTRNGPAAYKALKDGLFDLVIVDINVPNYNGFEMIMDINCMKPRPQVIAMTALAGSQDRKYITKVADALNVYRVYFKPFSVTEMLKTIMQHAGGNQFAEKPSHAFGEFLPYGAEKVWEMGERKYLMS